MTSGRRGRPKGVPNKQSKDQVAAAKRGGIMPVSGMLKAMRYWLRVFDDEQAKDPEAVGADGLPDYAMRPDLARMEYALDKMLPFAAQAAPYVHARLSAQAHYFGEDGDKLKAFLGARERLEALLTAAEQNLPLPLPLVQKVIDVQPNGADGESLTEAEAALLGATPGDLGTAH